MNAPSGFTPTRVAALAVIGMLVVGLVYLRFSGEEAVVPFPPERRAKRPEHARVHVPDGGR